MSSTLATRTINRGREGILVLLMVLAPIGLAVVVAAVLISAMAGWQVVRGAPVELPSSMSIRLYGLLSYAIASWIAVTVVWFWSARRGIERDVFIFRRLTWPALAASILGFVIAMYGVPIVTQWISEMTSARRLDMQVVAPETRAIAILVFLFVVTTPLCEEILYRGLLVAWLRRAGWGDVPVLLTGSLIFAANHVIPLGFVWSTAMVGLGVILFALRLRYESLTPAWLAHVLFNAQMVFPVP